MAVPCGFYVIKGGFIQISNNHESVKADDFHLPWSINENSLCAKLT